MSEHPLKNWYTQEDKLAVWQELGLNEAGVKQSVDFILDWCENQPHLAETLIDIVCIEKMLLLAKGSVERAKYLVDNFYKYRYWAPELIQDREVILNAPLKQMYRTFTMPILPNLYDGKRITFLRFAPSLTDIDAQEFFKICFMELDIRLKFDYWLSDIWIIDLTGANMSLFFSVKLDIIRRTVTTFQKGLKWRITAIHVVNVPVVVTVLQVILDVFKLFVSSKIMSRVVIHDSLESLHKQVPKEYLPEDLGGTAPSLDALTDSMERNIKNPIIKQALTECSKMVSNENKRLNSDTSDELAGCFKRLEFD